MSSRDRLLATLGGETVDRIATFDIIHSMPLIERLSGGTLREDNAEDLLCAAVRVVLDLVRHFAVPDRMDRWYVHDGMGFTYEYRWWTAHVVKRPEFESTSDVAAAVERDIEAIYGDMARGRICHVARQHVRLFDESYQYIGEAREEFRRLSGKLEGTMMLAPEDVSVMGVAAERFDEQWWWPFYADFPQLAGRYMDALTDYQMYFIRGFACPDVSPFAQISVPTGTTSGLLYSPEFFRTEVIPRERKKIVCWKSHGYHVLGFLDGYKWPLLDDFLDTGVEEIHPCEPSCRMDVGELRRRYPRVPLGQPIDCSQLLPFGSAEQVRQAVRKSIADAGETGILVGSTSEIHCEVKVENAISMYETARGYPLA